VFFHEISALPGQSGSPIIEIGADRSFSIVGIHKGAADAVIKGVKGEKTINVGRIITQDLINTLKQEATNHGAYPFQVR
jgi:V8-like Glu-specific endopeptidase